MRKFKEMMNELEIKAVLALEEVKNSERGDTNFVSMLLIIGIVVVLAGLFLTLGKGTMTAISDKVNAFIASLG